MKKLLVGFQLLFATIFLGAFVVSFFVLDGIKESSKIIITEKVVDKVSSNVAVAEEILHSNAAANMLADYQRSAIFDEINDFKKNPVEYVEALTLDEEKTQVIPPGLSSNNPLKNALIEKIFGWKLSLKRYFQETFSGLVVEIRIFLASNVVALLIAAFVCVKGKMLGRDAIIISTLLTAVIALSALNYVNQNWFYTILLNSYSGYGYIIGILSTTAWLYYQYLSARKENAP